MRKRKSIKTAQGRKEKKEEGLKGFLVFSHTVVNPGSINRDNNITSGMLNWGFLSFFSGKKKKRKKEMYDKWVESKK